MNKYRITYRFTACKARHANNKEVREYKFRTTENYSPSCGICNPAQYYYKDL